MKTQGIIASLLSSIPVWSQEPLCETNNLGNPHLVSGLAECSATGLRTVFRIQENAEIRWDRMNLASGRELEFVFTGGSNTIVNRSMGRTTLHGQLIGGEGNVVILSPDNSLTIGGNAVIRSGSFVASNLDADSSQFLEPRKNWQFTEGNQSAFVTDIRGQITTTRGDIILVTRGDLNLRGARIQAAGDFAALSGTEVTLTPGSAETISVTPSDELDSQIIHQGGDIRAGGDLSFIARDQIFLSGGSVFTADQGLGQVFMRVDDSGSISIRENSGTLTIRGRSVFSQQATGELATIDPNEGGTPGALSPAVNEFPTRAPRSSQTLLKPTSAAVTARSGKVFSSPKVKATTRKSPLLAKSTTIPGLRKRSFFRSRATVKAKKKP